MKPEVKRYTTKVGSRDITVETGKLAAQAGGAVTVHLNDSIVFAAATMGGIREGIDFFPPAWIMKNGCTPAARSLDRSSGVKVVRPPMQS